jgi:hypothetical protein
LAFLVKSCLASAAIIAHVQWLWRTLRRKDITMGGIDAAFSVESSIWAFMNVEMISKVKVGTAMAIIAW